jgi:hypothetical protein
MPFILSSYTNILSRKSSETRNLETTTGVVEWGKLTIYVLVQYEADDEQVNCYSR